MATLVKIALERIPNEFQSHQASMVKSEFLKCSDVKSIMILYDDGSIRTTPRGTQDKQPLALTWCELPWAPADYKTQHNIIESLVRHGSSREPHL